MQKLASSRFVGFSTFKRLVFFFLDYLRPPRIAPPALVQVLKSRFILVGVAATAACTIGLSAATFNKFPWGGKRLKLGPSSYAFFQLIGGSSKACSHTSCNLTE